ncbi:D-tyrosyl-tRNA(Tyr) deacylase [Candidatus Woesebacteria bacterium]|nr:MAG: D-tyrosyl-tRNA(Tyr) deacylase [Candidatus Woesebacteria bacterium]
MRLVIQRVKEAKVFVKEKDKVVGKISKGLFILMGVTEGDSKEDAEKLAEKVSKLRIMADENGKMNLSIKDVGGEILVVSQFTLYADTRKGNRPSFIKASVPGLAKDIYEHFVTQLEGKGVKVETGEFGAYMEIDTDLDGPVTIIL